MINKIYIYLIFYIFKKNFFFYTDFFFIKNNLEKKIFLNFFFKLNFEIKKILNINIFNKKKYFNFFIKIYFIRLNNLNQRDKAINKLNFLNFKLIKKNMDINSLNLLNIFNFYKNIFLNLINIKSININYLNFYFNKKKTSIILINMFKRNFLKLMEMVINLSFFNLKLIAFSEIILTRETKIFNNYLDIILNKRGSFVLIINPKMKLKNIYTLKNLKLPVIAPVDEFTNLNWVDYPIYFLKITNFSIFFFFSLVINLFFSGQNLKNKENLKNYNSFKKLNFLKEFFLNIN